MARGSTRQQGRVARSELESNTESVVSFDEAVKSLGNNPTFAQVRKLAFSLLDDMKPVGTKEVRALRDYEFALRDWRNAIKEAKDEGKPEPTTPKPISPIKPETEISKDLSGKISQFVYAFQEYQSNDSVRDKNKLVEAFKELPKSMQEVLSLEAKDIPKLYRGDEAKRGEGPQVASFATDARNAGFWGSFLYRGTDVESYEGGIDTVKVSKFIGTGMRDARGRASDISEKLSNKYGRFDHTVGDDEDERILYGIKWKDGVGKEDWMKKNDRDIKTLKEKKPEMFE